MSHDTDTRAKAIRILPVLLAAVVLSACGSADSASVPAPDYEPAIARAPGELATLYANGPELIDGGQVAYDETLASLRGYPVVVNNWGSWCGPCQEEFPYFQAQAAAHLDEVAFLGVDSADSPAAYETFVRDNPVPYPSVADPDRELPKWIDTALVGQPNTLFYDREGELVYTHQGPYPDEETLAADIEKYALSS